jgi:fluoroquinolone transport system permease protein
VNAAARAVHGLGPVDLRSIWRDPLLAWMIAYPLVLALLARWLVPLIGDRVLAEYGLDIEPYYPLIAGGLLVLAPMLTGMVVGFLMLDQKDDGTLAALAVTPLTRRGYLVYRLVTPTVVSVPVAAATVWLTGLNDIAAGWRLVTGIAAAPLALLMAVFLATFAENKVQGFALVKALGAVGIVPVLAWWVPMPGQLLFGLVPSYWPMKLYWVVAAGEPTALAYLAVGLAWQLACLAWLLRRFQARR